ncbi:MAG: hypothetical protein ACW99U_15585 [Candidatus Thorarchaeota archaeon]|jgi:hypothetical protein
MQAEATSDKLASIMERYPFRSYGDSIPMGKVEGRAVRTAPSIDQFLIYCAWKILQEGDDCTFERLTVECFARFPEKFSLQGYPEYPDSARVNKSWLRCRTDRGWLLGNVKTSFNLSPSGEAVAVSVERSLGLGDVKEARRPASRVRTRDDALLRFVRNRPLYGSYLESPKDFAPTDNDIRVLTSSTLDTPRRVVKQNLMQLVDVAKKASEKDLEGFLLACLKSFSAAKKGAEL